MTVDNYYRFNLILKIRNKLIITLDLWALEEETSNG